jgi:hypothetical protein
MFSFRRLRLIWNESICVNRAQERRLAGWVGPNSTGAGGTEADVRKRLRPSTPAALILALTMAAAAVVQAQDASSNAPAQTAGQSDSNAAPSAQGQTAPGQTGQDQAGQETAGQISVQERIRQRQQLRRAAAIHDAYDHLFESYVGMGYLRFQPGAHLQRTTFYGWNTGLTRYYTERLGVDVDARGYYGIAYTGEIQGVTNATNTRPKISEYNVLAGPTYRFYLQPKYSISGRVLGGFALGNFSGDTNGFGSTTFGIWPDATTYAVSGSVIGQYNWSPGVSLRLTGEDFATGFGSTVQNSFGFTAGFVYRFGKQ